MELNDIQVEKKEYHSPRLLIYGNINEMTKATSDGKGALDGATHYAFGDLKTGGNAVWG